MLKESSSKTRRSVFNRSRARNKGKVSYSFSIEFETANRDIAKKVNGKEIKTGGRKRILFLFQIATLPSTREVLSLPAVAHERDQ